MKLKKCILTANACYKKNQKMTGGKPTGIVVHSTGANNKTLKRYVQPLKTDIDYNMIIADIGVNANGNHWNVGNISKCVHAFIGVNANGEVETYQTLPYDVCCWGVGNGTKGSYNYNPNARIQFEICEDGLTDKAYFEKVFKEAIEYCAYLCGKFGFGVDKICSHRESHLQGYGGNHGDCDHWLKKFGKDMDWFRAEVQKLLKKPTTPIKAETGVKDVKVNGINIVRSTDYLVVYAGKPTTGTNQYGTEVIVNADGVVTNTPTYGKGNTAIPSNGFVLSGHGKMSKWLLDNIKKGDKINLSVTSK